MRYLPPIANFVLHYVVAKRDLASDLAAVGAMLPDLWRMANRRARPALTPVASEEPRVERVLAGIAHHAAFDASFHASSAFTEGERTTRDALATVGAPRITLFAHVAWEMALDGALVRRGDGALLSSLRADLDEATRDDATQEAARLHFRTRDREVPADFAARMDHFLRELARGPFVSGYAHAAEIAARLDAIRARVGVARLTADERLAVETAMRSIEPLTEPALVALGVT